MFKKFLVVLLGLSLIACGQLQAAPNGNNGKSQKDRPGQVEHGKQFAPGQVKKQTIEDPVIAALCVAAVVVIVGGTLVYVYYKSTKCIDNPRCEVCNRRLQPGDAVCGTCQEPVPPGTWPPPPPAEDTDGVIAPVYTTSGGVEYTYWEPLGSELQTTTDLMNWTPISFVENTGIDMTGQIELHFINDLSELAEWEAVTRLGLVVEGQGEFLHCFSTNTISPSPMRFFRQVEVGIELE